MDHSDQPSVFKVFIPYNKGFDVKADKERKAASWETFPDRNDESATNCVEAATDTMRAVGFLADDHNWTISLFFNSKANLSEAIPGSTNRRTQPIR
jgi:hypothetical protein